MIQNDLTGMGFDGRDQLMGDDFGWVQQVWLQDLYVMLRYALARRIVSDSADQIVDAGIVVSATGLDANKVDDLSLYLDERTKDNSLHDALVNAMAFGMGAEIIILEDGRDLSEPVDEANIIDVAGIISSHRWELTPYAWGSNPVVKTAQGWRVNPFYQEPIVYSYTPWMYGSDTLNRGGDWLNGEQGQVWQAPTWDKIKSGTMIHASRIAHYPGIKLPNLLQRDNGGYADPILRQCRRPILAWEGHVHHAGDAGRHLSELVYKGDRLTQVIDTPMSGVTTPEQAQRYLSNVIAQQQLMSSYKGVRLLQNDESLEYLAKPLSGFDQVTQVVMIANAVASGIPLETLFNVSPPGGIGAAGAGRFIWDNYASSIRRRFSGGVAPARRKFYRYAALAKNGPIAAELKMQLSLGTLTTETLLERAQRKQAEYSALTEAMQGGWVDAREIRAREKQSKDDFIQLDDKYDADLQRPGGLDLSAFVPKPAGEPVPSAADETPPTSEPARAEPEPTRTDSVDIAPDGSLVPGLGYDAGAVLSMHDEAYVWLTNGQPNDLGKWVRLQGEVSPQGAAFMALKSFAEAGEQKPLVAKLSAALTTEQAAAAGEALNQAFADEPQVKTDAVEAPPETWQGIPVRISHRAGSPRHGIIMPAHYGDLPGVMGADGDAVDMLYGPVPDSRVAYVVKQLKPDGAFDEFKCMLGFAGPREAVTAYMMYAPAVTAYGGMTEVPAGELIDWLKARA